MNQERSLKIVGERGGQRCPFCHGDIIDDEPQQSCETCSASHHFECWEDHGGCSSCGKSRSPEPAGAPQQARRRARRPAAGRLGGRATLRTEATEEQSVFEWGPNRTDAGFLRLGGLAFLSMTAALFIGFLAEIVPLALLAPMPTLLLVGPILFIYSFFALKKGRRLVASAEGLRFYPYDFWTRRRPDALIGWDRVARVEVRRQASKHAVYLIEQDYDEHLLGAFALPQPANQLATQLEQAKARFASTIDPSSIRIQRRD